MTDLSAPPPLPMPLSQDQCRAMAGVDDDTAKLCCWLIRDHDGAHWDYVDHIWWAVPDA